ncbi:DNA methyltransferase [Burkholderia gladioli]|uniref:DNA methyltransferase n=1 Tax=Burkholderia gladioli TaxID=28095 RepID=UPI001641D414|nr:DNA methyltransferase [Burkholderia gladioli]
MKLRSVIVVLRHNTDLGGDLRLAQREFDSLLGQPGEVIVDREHLKTELGDGWSAQAVELSINGAMVARRYINVASVSLERLVRRSAFAQEVFVIDERPKIRRDLMDRWPLPCLEVRDLSGLGPIILLSQSYIIESEGVLEAGIMADRVASTAQLLLEPYDVRKLNPRANRLRRAKKTTLSLTHDLHIYKAKFFPRMVRALLNVYATDGAKILDPYCGSGTALLEASLLGLDSYGCDIDPICYLISRTKVDPFVDGRALSRATKQFLERLGDRDDKRPTFAFPQELKAKIERRDRIDQTSFLGEIVEETTQLASALAGLRRDHPEEELLFTLASDAVTKKVRYRFIGVGNGRYTIEIVKQPLLERMREKVHRSEQLAGVFAEIQELLDTKLGRVRVAQGDARDRNTWPINKDIDVIITSPPYLPASSGREHYASSRSLAFAMLGYPPGESGYFDMAPGDGTEAFKLARFSEAARLMTYLESDASAEADPQRDAMRFERKAVPTLQYLADVRRFFESAKASLSTNGVLLVVIAHHHTFYSHRRQEIEHIVSGCALYAEIAADVGLDLIEEIEMELLKAKTSKARPMAKEDYYESVLVFRPQVKKLRQPRVSVKGATPVTA